VTAVGREQRLFEILCGCWLFKQRIGYRAIVFDRFVANTAGLHAFYEVIDDKRRPDAVDRDWF